MQICVVKRLAETRDDSTQTINEDKLKLLKNDFTETYLSQVWPVPFFLLKG